MNDICLRANDQQCVTASDDGSCIVWDLQRFMRSNIMYAQTYFKAVAYFNDESQILTTGSDRKVLATTVDTQPHFKLSTRSSLGILFWLAFATDHLLGLV